MDTYIKEMPKAELHCHLDGSIPIDTLYRLAKRNNIDPLEMDNATAPSKCSDLQEYLKSFDSILAVLQKKEDLIEATYSLIEAVSSENVKYIEIRFAPLLHMEEGLTIEEVIESVSKGIEKGIQEYNIYVNLLICCMRHDDNESNDKLIEKIHEIRNNFIVGFDFAGNEEDNANDIITNLTESIHKKGYELTLHSGECGCVHNIVQAVKLGANRIGHGVAIKEDKELLFDLQERDIHFEICPTSNVQTNAVQDYEELPLKLFLENNISFSINTDNRTVSNTTLSKEFNIIKYIFNLSNQDILNFSLNAIDNSFADRKIKEIIKVEMEDFYQKSLN